jgi:hypothetical protein
MMTIVNSTTTTSTTTATTWTVRWLSKMMIRCEQNEDDTEEDEATIE